MFNLSDPQTFVTVAFILLVGVSFKKISKMLGRVLDVHGSKVRSDLDAAKKLREEAEAILAIYRKKQSEFALEAENILKKARDDSNYISAHAEAELKILLDARTKQALEKIALEETAALIDVRNHVADIALAAARSIIVDQVANLSQDELLKLAIADIERKIH